MMNWKIDFYHGVEEQILTMPPKLQARMIKLLKLMEKHGANLGPPHTEAMDVVYLRSEQKHRKGLGEGFFAIYMANTYTCCMPLLRNRKRRQRQI